MKKLFLAMVTSVLAAGVNPVNVNKESLHLYPKTMIVDHVDYSEDMIYMVDSVGYIWTIQGVEDIHAGDILSCLMHDNYSNIILDDVIVDYQYSGYYIDNGKLVH